MQMLIVHLVQKVFGKNVKIFSKINTTKNNKVKKTLLLLFIPLVSFGQTSDKLLKKRENISLTLNYFKIGDEKQENGDYYGAIAAYTKALELDSLKSIGSADIYNNRGNTKELIKDHYGAIADYTKTIEIDPNSELAYLNRGNSKVSLKDYYGSIQDYTKAIEINPKLVEAYNNRGNSKALIKDYYGAIADFTSVIEINPKLVEAYLRRGFAKELLGDLNGACSDYKKASSLGSSDGTKFFSNACK